MAAESQGFSAMASSLRAASSRLIIPPRLAPRSVSRALAVASVALPTSRSAAVSAPIVTCSVQEGGGLRFGARVWSDREYSGSRASILGSEQRICIGVEGGRAGGCGGCERELFSGSISGVLRKRGRGVGRSSSLSSGVRLGSVGERCSAGAFGAASVRRLCSVDYKVGGLRRFGVAAGRPVSAAMAEDLKNLKLDDGEAAESGNGVGMEKGKGKEDEVPGSSGRKTLEDLNWDHSFVRELPGDPRSDGPVRQVLHACYSRVTPSVHVKNPELVAWSESVADILDLDPQEFDRSDLPLIFTGASQLKAGLSYAQCYGGHQFGVWAGQLGDGRAITLGELLNSKGERWELQLKGAGKTPYSRTADGLAVLRSSVREFLCSEAMHHLGVPTTRALCLVTTGEGVLRDMFYDGNVKMEPGAVVCRAAPSFIRFGSFQIHAARDKADLPLVKQLADYTIHHHYPQFENMPFERQALKEGPSEAMKGDKENPLPQIDVSKNKYAAWFTEVGERTAIMIAKWQAVGFTHGVMNTDNMSILGLTIDYGPFGFLDAFDPKYTPNTTDLPGRRYGFANQPDIGLWNVMQLANTLYTAELITAEEAQFGLGRYADKFMSEYQQQMSNKVGLKAYNKDLLSKLLNNMAFDKVDYTNFFRSLGNLKAGPETSDDELLAPLKNALLDLSKERRKVWLDWLHQYIQLLVVEGVPEAQRKSQMDSVNPKYVLRNYLCQSAIDIAEQGDFSEVCRLLKVMERPYDDQPGMEKYARLPPAWAYRPGVCMLSCSS